MNEESNAVEANEDLLVAQQIATELAFDTEALKEFKINFEKRLERLPVYQELLKARIRVSTLEAELAVAIGSDGDLLAPKENIDSIESLIERLHEDLSMRLIAYRESTGENSIPIEDNKSQEIIITGKLGKIVYLEKR